MKETIVLSVFVVTGIYLITGLLFSIIFIIRGLSKMDEGAHGAGIGFKLIILPGCMVLWPFLLRKWIKLPPAQTDQRVQGKS